MIVNEPVSILQPRPFPKTLSPGPEPLKGYRVAPVYMPGMRVCPSGASKSRYHQSPLAPKTEMLTVLLAELDTDIVSPLAVEYEYDWPPVTQSPGSPVMLKEPDATVCAWAGLATNRPPTTAVSERAAARRVRRREIFMRSSPRLIDWFVAVI